MSDRPFSIGSLTGLRAFLINDKGGLTGVAYRDLYSPEVNTAVCHVEPWWTPETIPACYLPYIKDGHDFIGINCTCGFHAFFDGTNDYLHDPNGPMWSEYRIAGIIEGWGKYVVGPRGFRAEKARILALITPPDVDSETLATVRRRYPAAAWFDTQDAAIAEFPLTAEVPA